MPVKVLRYIVFIQNQDHPVYYSTDLGKDKFGVNNALCWAKITAKKYFGTLVQETSDGNRKEIKNYYKELY